MLRLCLSIATHRISGRQPDLRRRQLIASRRPRRFTPEDDANEAGTDAIDEVYAFNLAAEEEAWVYFYSQFSIVRLRKGKATVWKTRVQGARALAVRKHEALLLGDYDDPLAVRLLDLPRGGGHAKVRRKTSLRLSSSVVDDGLRSYASGSRIAVFARDTTWIVDRW